MAYQFIDATECLGDSLFKINNNASDFDQRIIALTNVVASLSTALVAADVALTQAVLSAAPVGAVQTFAMATAPSGWLECNGVTVPNGIDTIQGKTANFTALYNAVGTTYGGAGKLPDLRGEFVRGWDNGRGIDSGRIFGKLQTDAIRNITGSFGGVSGGTNVAYQWGFRPGSGTGAFSVPYSRGEYNKYNGLYYPAGGVGDNVNFNAANQVPTANENRPRNVALLYCIKY